MSDAPSLPLWKRALFVLAPLVVTLLLLEGSAALFGYERGGGDPFVGFSSRAPLYVAGTDDAGNSLLETAKDRRRFVHGTRFTPTKLHDQYRIFALGGSTTYGRPYDADTVSFPGWLRVLLPAVDPSRGWEVINAGGISYASYRVALAMEELVQYEPDLFIIYTGHNEFLEQRTYSALLSAPRWALALTSALRGTRTWSMLASLLLPKSSEGSALAKDPQAILDGSVGPDAYSRDDDWAEDVRSHLAFNLRRMVDLAEQAGAQIVFVTPGSNLAAFSPFRSQPGDDITAETAVAIAGYLAQADGATVAGNAAGSLAAIERAVALDPRDAELQRRRGRSLLELGRSREAADAFVNARDEDVCPLRAPTAVVNVVRDIARERGVTVVDFEARVGSLDPTGIPGTEQFLDHVHPTAQVYGTLAEWIVDALAQMQIVGTKPDWSEPRFDALRERTLARIDRRAEGAALRNLAKVLGWAGMVDEVDALLDRALERNPDDVEALITLSNMQLEDGNVDGAIEALAHALSVAPENHTVLDYHSEALLTAGRTAEALAGYRALLQLDETSVWTHNNVAWILATATEPGLRDPERALSHVKRAVRLQRDPDPLLLDTLAAAYAAGGDRDAALEAVDRAIALAKGLEDPDLRAGLVRNRARYAAGSLPPTVE